MFIVLPIILSVYPTIVAQSLFFFFFWHKLDTGGFKGKDEMTSFIYILNNKKKQMCINNTFNCISFDGSRHIEHFKIEWVN